MNSASLPDLHGSDRWEPFFDAYRHDPERWDCWSDFCHWLEEFILPGVAQIQQDFLDSYDCGHPFYVDCPDCGYEVHVS